jgi:putative transcriptional regulator
MKKTSSAILEAVHKTATGLHKARVMDELTLREFDQLCFERSAPLTREQIKNTCVSPRGAARLCALPNPE